MRDFKSFADKIIADLQISVQLLDESDPAIHHENH
jgi:hypothetical protein